MPNWKKLLTSGSNIQISELTLQAAGVHKTSIDTSGNIATEGYVSSSSELSGRAITIGTNGATKAFIDTSGNVVSQAGYVSASGELAGTSLTLKVNGLHRATIDTSGDFSCRTISGSGVLIANTAQFRHNGINTFDISNAGAISASSTIQGTALTLATNGSVRSTIDASGNLFAAGDISSSGGMIIGRDMTLSTNGVGAFSVIANGVVSASGLIQGTAFKQENNGNLTFVVDTSGNVSSSGTLSGTALTLATAGTQKAAITADGSASFAGGIDTFYDATASLGYITASQLIIQGTDQDAAISLKDNDGNQIGAIARCGSGGNAHKGRLVLRDNTDIKIELTPIGTSYVMGAFSSSGAMTANSFHQSSNGTTIASISNQGVINAKMGLITHTIGANTGDVVYFGGTTSMTTGKIYHYKSDGTWELADCNAAANSDGLLAVALGAASDTNGMLLRGMATLHTIDGTEAVGDVLYLSEDTTGNANSVAPAGNGDIVRVIGYCLHATDQTVWFNPDSTFVEVTA